MSFLSLLKRIFSYEKYMAGLIARRAGEVEVYLDANYHPAPEPEPESVSVAEKEPEEAAYSTEEPPEEEITAEKPKGGKEDKNQSNVRYSISAAIPLTREASIEIERRLDLLIGSEKSQKMLKSVHQAKLQTFVDYLRHQIYRQGLTGPQVYHAAQIDKRLYSKIISNTHYKPSRETAIALAFAVRLSLDDAKTLLSRAGYTLSETSRRDLILTYFFQNRSRNLIEINGVLDALGETPVGRG